MEKDRKEYMLRLPKELWQEVEAIAEEDKRPISRQIEYMISVYLKERKKI